MLSFFRRLSKSKIGTGIMAFVLIAILAGFAMADLSNFGTGSLGFGMGSSTLAKVGDQAISEREMEAAMQRRLSQVREQVPDADYRRIAGDFDALLAQMIDQRAIVAFAKKHGFAISKRLIDAEISDLPGVRGMMTSLASVVTRLSMTTSRPFTSRAELVLSGSCRSCR